MTVVGTRPELIKLSSVIRELDLSTDHVLVHTGQNWDRQLRDVFFADLGIRQPDHSLSVASSSLARSLAEVLVQVDEVLEAEQPDAFLVYGDTNSCLSALCAKRRRIPVFHMEAGNRSFDERVPEETNRRVIDHLSDVNFTNSERAREYLLREGKRPELVINTGSPMGEVLHDHAERIEASTILADLGLEAGGYFIVSCHREENVDDGAKLRSFLDQLRALDAEFGLPVIVSTHPRTQSRLDALDGASLPSSVTWSRPFSFSDYIALQRSARCVLSDSGSLTEEASLLGFPAVMLREAHERPEGSDLGVAPFIGLQDPRLPEVIATVVRQHRELGAPPPLTDYVRPRVSLAVVRSILSATAYVNRVIWQNGARGTPT